MAAVSSKQATAYLIDPLTAPEPSEETGPGARLTSPTSSSSKRSSSSNNSSNNPYRSPSGAHPSSHSRHTSNASNPDKFPNYREAAFSQLNGEPPAYNEGSSSGRRRGSSLKERFPGDDSHKPLDVLRRDSKKAHRSPHLHKRNMCGPDSIDRLDATVTAIPYHHEGPYDAASFARNRKGDGPVDALRDSNAETLKATPVENVKNSVHRHMPLEGVAQVPPGHEDRLGRTYQYEEGQNLMLDKDAPGGAYKRWPGVDYHPDDVKGKGEPSYSQDLAIKGHRRVDSKDHDGIEMDLRNHDDAAVYGDASGRVRSGSFKEGLKKRFGSLKKKHRDE